MGAAACWTPTQSFDKRQGVVLSELLSDQRRFCENKAIGSIIDDNFYSRVLPRQVCNLSSTVRLTSKRAFT